MDKRIFISYKRHDKERVFEIKDFIEAETNIPCWIDLDGIESNEVFKHVIINAINACEVMLFMYSHRHSLITDYENDWTFKELTFAQSQKKRIVFVNIDGTELTDIFKFDFGHKQQVDARDKSRLQKLAADIIRWLKPEESDITTSQTHQNLDKNPDTESQNSHSDSSKNNNEGIGVSKAVHKAFRKFKDWYHKSTDLSHASAQYNLGWCYYNGKGVPKDYREATKWFRKSAEQGNASAQFYLGWCYENGQGVPQDYKEAKKWYIKSAEQGNENAHKRFLALTNK